MLCRLAVVGQQTGDCHYVVSLMDRGIYADPLEEAGVHVCVLGMPRGRITLSGLFKLYRLIKKIQPDVVQTWMYHADLIGGVIARLAGIRAVSWGIRHANLDPDKNKRVTVWIAKLCARLSFWVPTTIISCSVRATQVHQKLGYQSDKFIDIPNGYAMEKFKPDLDARLVIRQELGIPDNDFVFGMVARFDPQKDHDNLISALARLKRSGQTFVCLLVGHGMDQSNTTLTTKLRVAEVTEQVKLLGSRQDIPAVMNTIDIHVLSSLGEAFPNVLAEAMACGTPCFATDVGDAALIIGKYGWVVAPRDSEALATGLTQAKALFKKDRQAWQERQRACRTHIMDNFELNLVYARYRRAWKCCHHAR